MPKKFDFKEDQLVFLSEVVSFSETEEKVPTEFRIAAAGVYRSCKGDFLFDDKAAKCCMEAWEDQSGGTVDGMVDYSHASLFAGFSENPKAAGEAAGWYRLELRSAVDPKEINWMGEDVSCTQDLWAVPVKWVTEAEQLLRDKKYRYFSPVLYMDEVRRITMVFNIALTNIPATKGQSPLMAFSQMFQGKQEKEKTMDPILKAILSALNIPETDAEKAPEKVKGIVAELEQSKVKVISLSSDHESLKSQILSATKQTSVDAGLASIPGLLKSKDAAETLGARVEKLEADRVTEGVAKILTQYQDRLTPEIREEVKQNVELAQAAHRDPLERVTAFLNACPKVVDLSKFTPPAEASQGSPVGTDGKVKLSKEEEKHRCALDLSFDDYVAIWKN